MTKSREGERERDFARVRPTSVEESVEVCGGIGRYVCACTHTRARNRRPKPFLVDVWVEDTHGRRKQRIMVITVIKRRPLRTRPTPPLRGKFVLFTQWTRKPDVSSSTI